MRRAGLHLPQVTHIIAYNADGIKENTLQCIGRAQRIGRDYNLDVILTD